MGGRNSMLARVAVYAAIAASGVSAFMGGSLAPSCLNRLPLATSARRAPAEGPKMVDITVQVSEGEPIEAALRRFKISCSRSGHLMELKRRRTFETKREEDPQEQGVDAQQVHGEAQGAVGRHGWLLRRQGHGRPQGPLRHHQPLDLSHRPCTRVCCGEYGDGGERTRGEGYRY